MPGRRLAVLLALALSGCPDAPSFDELGVTYDVLDTGEAAPTTSGSAGEEPSSGTSTGDVDPSTTSFADETAGPVNPSPMVWLMIDPSKIVEAGSVAVDVEVSDDVVAVDVVYRDVVQVSLAPREFPYSFAVTSKLQCDEVEALTVIAHDDEGQIAEDSEDLTCSLPAGGSEAAQLELPGQTGSIVHAVAVLGDGFVAVGVLDDRMVVWRLGPDLKLLPGWPKTVGAWTAIVGLDKLSSSATAVTIDSEQNIIVAGNFLQGGTTTYYVGKLNAAGSRLAEAQGGPHEEAAGVAVTADGVIVVAGRFRTSMVPEFDWLVAGHAKLGKAKPWRDLLPLGPGEDPDEFNERNEQARAVAVLASGEVVVVGEREYKEALKDLPFNRASWQRYTSGGERVGPLWTSRSDVPMHDAANAVVVLPDDSVAITGWMRIALGQPPQLFTRRFVGDTEKQYRLEPAATAEAKGLAHDREGNLVIAAAMTQDGQLDAWAFAFPFVDWSLATVWSQPPFGEPGGWDIYTSVACTEWGYCLAGGFLTKNKVATGFLRLHNP